jgi:acyl-CoA hydrolase
MGFREEYKQKRTTAKQAVPVVRSGDWIEYGELTGMPRCLDRKELIRTAEAGDPEAEHHKKGGQISNLSPFRFWQISNLSPFHI